MSAEHDDVREFAALLRQLKDRTERSYSSLARRVGMNTSTLHRYCAGDAVPQDYAPVERLAAFCGATPDERVTLHHHWLRALAARQRSASPADGTGDRPPAAEADAGVAGARFGWARRRWVVGVGTAVVLVAAWGGVSAALHDGRDAPTGGGPSRAAVSGTALSPSGRQSRSPGRRTAPPSPSSSASGKPSGSPSATPRTTRPEPRSGPPLAVSVDSQVWRLGCDHDYVIAKEPGSVPPPPAPQDAGVWAATQGAVHGRETDVRITVQGRSDAAVVLEALRVRVVGRTAPAQGTAYSMAQGCGGGMSPRYFAVNLDKDRPIARPAPADPGTAEHPVSLPYRVSAKDPEELLVRATTDGCDCRWYLELDWSSQGRTGTVRIDDHGGPFRTSAIKGLPHYWYGSDGGRRRWVPLTG
ncbi:helix-turn-helix domain-containing protein [Streptomyces sp. LP11]|uniref:Helix-turn-helix domain-containing protein n=1 Tax=Streptomyces pyxinicus TaxID=2970331 RepID=A0ABT2B0Q4_9ACTN|nr:helix-turn-helix transcriptional regulator [Streptomyces sp. LP11]MCS0602093.1 helix-turn-helix domain-containing protein [Streptomyces sp. LP11]